MGGMADVTMTGTEAIRSELWNLGVQFIITGRRYQLARHGGTSATDWNSFWCWPIMENGDVVRGAREREIKIPNQAKVTITRPGKPGYLSWEEWVARGYQA